MVGGDLGVASECFWGIYRGLDSKVVFADFCYYKQHFKVQATNMYPKRTGLYFMFIKLKGLFLVDSWPINVLEAVAKGTKGLWLGVNWGLLVNVF